MLFQSMQFLLITSNCLSWLTVCTEWREYKQTEVYMWPFKKVWRFGLVISWLFLGHRSCITLCLVSTRMAIPPLVSAVHTGDEFSWPLLGKKQRVLHNSGLLAHWCSWLKALAVNWASHPSGHVVVVWFSPCWTVAGWKNHDGDELPRMHLIVCAKLWMSCSW